MRGQINFTRWFFLALQGDVGGFTAGSQIAWLATGTLGINFTRNIFVEAGYRYYYVDYTSGSFSYKVAEAGPSFMDLARRMAPLSRFGQRKICSAFEQPLRS